MEGGGFSWTLLTILGPILLFVVLLWAVLRNRKAKPGEIERTERATHDQLEFPAAYRSFLPPGDGNELGPACLIAPRDD